LDGTEDRERDACQNCNNCDYDEQFDQGEGGGSFLFHGHYFMELM
jgi:hypothetical protein